MSITNKLNNGYLLSLFQKDLQERLVKVAMDSIKPHVMQAVKEAMRELDTEIRAHYDSMEGELVVQLIVKEEKP